jgi:hypothetical protein
MVAKSGETALQAAHTAVDNRKKVPYLLVYRPQPNFQTEIIEKNNFIRILFQE